jgi:CheY-like chemotaxis protein
MSARDRIQRISDLLKAADRYVLEGEFDKAAAQVDRVFSLDPENIYAKAYLKRIEVFKGKYGGSGEPSGATADVRAQPDEQIESGRQTIGPDIPAAPETGYTDTDENREQFQQSEAHRLIQRRESSGKLSSEDERKIVEEIIAKEAELLEALDTGNSTIHRPAPEPAATDPDVIEREERERKYRKALEELWKSGAVSPEDRQEIEQLRFTLEISDERHDEIERSVKLSAYVNAVKNAWEEELITPTSAAALEELRDRYNISVNEHLMIESRIIYELHGRRIKGVVMVIDDDAELGKIIKSILREEGYAPFSANSPEHGLQILERTTPDLILLDVTFPKPSMSGFTTYEHIRKKPHLRFVPVIFLSGLDEEHIVQVGKKLGADDYITKPCSEQLLVSTIEGKIKRYKEMRKALERKE